MKKETLGFKTEQFFAKNWKYIFYTLMITLIVVAWELHTISSRMENLEKIVFENNSKVVFTTIDGRAIRVEKTPIKAEYLKQFAVSTLVNNFIVSRASLTDDFKKNSFTQYSEILEQSPNLGLIYKYYLGDRTKNEDKQAFGDFISYLQWILSAIAQDKLPEYINIRDYRVVKYDYVENKFNIQLEIHVAISSYIIAKNSYIDQQGVIKLIASGDFDLARGTDFNPYGMKINSFSISLPTKGGKE